MKLVEEILFDDRDMAINIFEDSSGKFSVEVNGFMVKNGTLKDLQEAKDYIKSITLLKG